MPQSEKISPSPYYQKLADILTIFWEYHKARLEAGTIAFGYELTTGGVRPYHGPTDAIHEMQQSAETLGWEKPMKLDIINPFSRAVFRSLNVSWQDFVTFNHAAEQQLRMSGHRDQDTEYVKRHRGKRAGVESMPFKDLYVDKLIHACVQEEFKMQSHGHFTEIIPGGLGTGVNTTVDLLAVMNRFFKPAMPLLVSRTSLEALALTRSAVGRNSLLNTQPYHGIDPTSPTMFDMQTLIEAGYGRAMGCPAGRMPTEETQQFLETAIGHRVERPMLIDFSRALAAEYDRTIGEWWRGLDDAGREQAAQQITEECYMLVSGKKLEEIRAQREAERAAEIAAAEGSVQQPRSTGESVSETRRRGPRKRK